jgi:hypothetical protein
MARHTLLPDILTAFEGSEPACATDPIDEYRDLAMLARAWERIGSGGVTVDEAGGILLAGTASIPKED